MSQAFKSRGIHTTAVDSARCAHVLARCYVATDPDADPGFRATLAAAGHDPDRVEPITSADLDPDRYPAYIAPRTISFRAERS